MLKGKSVVTLASDKSDYREEFWGNNTGYIKTLKKHKCQEKHVFKEVTTILGGMKM